jgi:hypothetical protein
MEVTSIINVLRSEGCVRPSPVRCQAILHPPNNLFDAVDLAGAYREGVPTHTLYNVCIGLDLR